MALGWAILACLGFAILPWGTSSSTTTDSSGTVIETTTDESLLEHEGASVLIVLAVPALLTLVAVVVKRRPVRLGVGFALLAACMLAAMSVGLFFLPAALLVLWAASASPRSHPPPGATRSSELVLSGFITERSYAERRPDWESGRITTLDDAIAQAKAWVHSYGPSAVVEVIEVVRLEGKVGRVVQLVGSEAVDDI